MRVSAVQPSVSHAAVRAERRSRGESIESFDFRKSRRRCSTLARPRRRCLPHRTTFASSSSDSGAAASVSAKRSSGCTPTACARSLRSERPPSSPVSSTTFCAARMCSPWRSTAVAARASSNCCTHWAAYGRRVSASTFASFTRADPSCPRAFPGSSPSAGASACSPIRCPLLKIPAPTLARAASRVVAADKCAASEPHVPASGDVVAARA